MDDTAAARFADLGAAVEEVGPVFEPLLPRFKQYWVAGFGHILRADRRRSVGAVPDLDETVASTRIA